jgi:drug/metabolite transporter (DMT)-like permease
MDSRGRGFGIGAMVLTLLGWSSVPLFLRHFAESIDVWSSNGWRYGFAALLWAPLIVVMRGRGRLPAGIWRDAVVPSAINSLSQVVFVAAHYQIEPGVLSFGLRSQLVFAAVGAYLLFPSERGVIRSFSYLLGGVLLLTGTAGALFLSDEPIRAGDAFGIALAVASGMLFAAYGLSVRACMHRHGSAIAFAVISQYTAGAMVALMFVFGREAGLTVASILSGADVVLLLLSSVIGIALGHVLFYMSIARLGVAVSSGVLQLHPFVVAVGSLAIFDERLTPAQWAGGAVALVGAALMLRRQTARPASRPQPTAEPGRTLTR